VTTIITLEDLADVDTDEVFNLKPPLKLDELVMTEHPSPSVVKNLAKLQKLGILSGDTIMALIGQAPIDPINLMGTLMQMNPDGWAFSAIDFSMIRVLSRTPAKAVASALRVDLMGGAITSLVLNKANQLTIYKTLDVEPSPTMLDQIKALCEDAIEAAVREAREARTKR
jgi:hypothetical protein